MCQYNPRFVYFYPLFEGQKHFFQKILSFSMVSIQERFVIKSGLCILSARCRLFSNFMQIMAAKGCHLQYVCTYCQFVTCANFELSSNAEPYNEKSWDFYITIWGTFKYLSRFVDGLAHPNLCATLATDQKWPLICCRISYQTLAECHLP